MNIRLESCKITPLQSLETPVEQRHECLSGIAVNFAQDLEGCLEKSYVRGQPLLSFLDIHVVLPSLRIYTTCCNVFSGSCTAYMVTGLGAAGPRASEYSWYCISALTASIEAYLRRW